MSVIVVLSDCPPKLRGDMTKWFFEINTGVYVGNFSARVRDNLWQRITENIGHGHATMVYNAPGEQGMDFRVHNAYWEPVDFDGIKLMRRPEHKKTEVNAEQKNKNIGFSNASKNRHKKAYAGKPEELAEFLAESYVILDFETTGLDTKQNEIMEIGAVLVDRGKVTEKLQCLVRCNNSVPEEITKLTGITDHKLNEEGKEQEEAVNELLDFAEDLPFVCHNAPFEQSFLTEACSKMDIQLENRFIDTLKLAQILLPELGNYKLASLADHFGIPCPTHHRALPDCESTYGIYVELKKLISAGNELTRI